MQEKLRQRGVKEVGLERSEAVEKVLAAGGEGTSRWDSCHSMPSPSSNASKQCTVLAFNSVSRALCEQYVCITVCVFLYIPPSYVPDGPLAQQQDRSSGLHGCLLDGI